MSDDFKDVGKAHSGQIKKTNKEKRANGEVQRKN
jgi:hypothetical protein